ncbi:hypothetical protein [Litchfieldia salsa]|uniref:Uncharacterized protein n=1 Tax=Litchfieldia salsa TaxID=930152 RepID=A0A1H0VNF1_9BACI|nr:hypothetical protein [Litchfieldia salsa]SDP79791.1 hypothetical protein SAMN05216565_10788 [Litchfieldia salsa]
MRIAYSVIREIHNKNFLPQGKDYGLNPYEFVRLVRHLEELGYIERVLIIDDEVRLGPARITEKGRELIKTHTKYEEDYPFKRENLKKWIAAVEKEQYSNGAEEG